MRRNVNIKTGIPDSDYKDGEIDFINYDSTFHQQVSEYQKEKALTNYFYYEYKDCFNFLNY